MTAADVAFSANRALDPARRFTIISRIPSVTNSEATGPLTVRFTTRVADPILDKRLASLAILPKALVEGQGEETFFKNPVGSGPFRFKEFVPDDRLTVTGWKDHPFRKPKLDTLTLKNVPEAAQRLNGLRAGEVDYATGLPLGPQVSTAVNDMRYYIFRGIPSTCYGAEGGNAHAVDEWLDLESMPRLARTMASLVVDWCGIA